MSSTISLIRNPWKVSLHPSGTSPIASLISLYDLLYTEDGTFRYNAGVTYDGLKLSHDIFKFDANILGTDGIPLNSSTPDEWYAYGIDFAPVTFDPRAKATFVANNNFNPVQWNGSSQKGWILHDKDSAMYPDGLEYFHGFDISTDPRPWYEEYKDSTNGWSDYGSRPIMSISSDTESTSATLIVGDESTVFQSTLTTENGISALQTMALNPASVLTWKIVAYLTDRITDSTTFTKSASELQALFGKDSDVGADVLKNTYLWVRCSFFADFVDQDDFNQDLNAEANVVHKNLQLSGDGDFNRYDEITHKNASVTSKTSTQDTATRPYIPVTAPGYDILSNRLLTDYDTMSLTDAVKAALDASGGYLNDEFTEKTLGAIPVAPINRTEADSEQSTKDPTIQSLNPVGFFDPESRLSAADYGDKPALLPLHGNLLLDGRILSPSIDELWIYLKRLVSGRTSDAKYDAAVETSPIEASNTAGRTDQDTLPIAPRTDKFNYYDAEGTASTKIGDSLEQSIYAADLNSEQMHVLKFVSNPEQIKYLNYAGLDKVLARAANANTARATMFYPWKTLACDNTAVIKAGGIVDNQADSSSDQYSTLWQLRDVPLSLRELEARFMQLKFNFIEFARFVIENYATTSILTHVKTDESDPHQSTAGGLYQLHKDYNGDCENPNTLYEKAKVVTYGGDYGVGVTGTDADSIPDDPQSKCAAKTYLAADGQYHSVWEDVRLPIVDEEF